MKFSAVSMLAYTVNHNVSRGACFYAPAFEEDVCMDVGADPATAANLMARMTANAGASGASALPPPLPDNSAENDKDKDATKPREEADDNKKPQKKKTQRAIRRFPLVTLRPCWKIFGEIKITPWLLRDGDAKTPAVRLWLLALLDPYVLSFFR